MSFITADGRPVFSYGTEGIASDGEPVFGLSGTSTSTPPTDYARWLLEDHPRCFLFGVQYAYAGSPSPPVNVALASNGATVSAPLGSGTTKPVTAVIDGNRNGPFNGGTWVQLNSLAVDPHPSVEITFAGSEDVYEVRVYHVQDTGIGNPVSQPVLAWEQEANVTTQCADWAITEYTLDYWDGAAWVVFMTVTGNTNAVNIWQYGRDYDVLPTTTKIRLYVNDCQGGTGAGARARLQQIEVYNGIDPQIGTRYFSTLPFSSGGNVYDTSVLSLPAYSEAINADTLTGLASVNVSGPAVFNNKDGHLDWMKTAIFDGRPCTLLSGDPSWDLSDFETVYTVYAKKAVPTADRTIVLEVSDGSFLAGTITPAVVKGTTQPAPIPFGKATVQMYLEDAATNRWRFCDPPYWNTPLKETGITEIWDGGVSLNGATVLPSASAPSVATYYDGGANVFLPSVAYTDVSTSVGSTSINVPAWSGAGGAALYVALAVPSASVVVTFDGWFYGTWTLVQTATMGDAVVRLYRTTRTNVAADPPLTVGVSFDTPTTCSGVAIAMRGCDTSADDAYGNDTGTTSPITLSSLTASGASDTLLTFWFARGPIGVTLGTASGSGTTEQIEGYSSDAGTNFWAQSIDTQALSASGATGTRTVAVTGGSGANCVIGVLLKPQPSASINTGTDTFTVNSHGFANDDVVTLSMSAGGTAPGGLVDSNVDNGGRYTQYWAINVSTNAFKLAATRGGTAIDITSSGSGSITFTARKYYDVGEGSVLLNDTPTATPMAEVQTTGLVYISDLLEWVHFANGGQSSMWGGLHPSYIAGATDTEYLDPQPSSAITSAVGVFTLWDMWSKAACAFVAFDNDGRPYAGRIRTNPLDLPVDPDDFNTAVIDFTDQDVLGSKSLTRLDPKYRLASIIADQNRPPMSQSRADADASTVQTLKAKGVVVSMPNLTAGDYSTRPDLYHIGMIDTLNIPAEIVADSTYSIPFLNNFVSRLYPFIDRRTFQAPWRAHQVLLGDKVSVNQPNAFGDDAAIEGQIIAKTLRPYDGGPPSVDVTIVYRTVPDSTTSSHG